MAVVVRPPGITGRPSRRGRRATRSGQLPAEPEDGPPFVVSLTDTLIDALARASQGDLVRCAEQWSTTDELRQIGIRVEATTDVLAALAGLAQRAQTSDQRLYCWWAL
ncbi:hypothetical protein [Streptomyces sp. NPDC096153]|uniref:hypothetical protein n=1 Tax=Streptomyces sp. NPDC096153 TaxID=3155548 RepID=UPI00332C933B